MKKLALVFTLLCGLVAGTIPALAQGSSGNAAQPNQVAGEIMVSEYGKWVVTTLSPIAAGTATVNFAPCFVRVGTGNRQIFPFWANGAQALNVPIYVLDGSNSEAVTSESSASFPAQAPVSYPQPFICSVTATFANAHSAGVTFLQRHATLHADKTEVISDCNGKEVKKRVVIRAQADNVFSNVGAVVWLAERPNMGSLRVGTQGPTEASPAHLASKVIVFLDTPRQLRVANRTNNRSWSPFWFVRRRLTFFNGWCFRSCLYQLVFPDPESRFASDLPETLDCVQPVITVTRHGRKRGVELVSTNDPNRKSPRITFCQSLIAASELLV